jgi:peptide/nickel transport system substrate-binding protein
LLSTAALALASAIPSLSFAQDPVQGGSISINVGSEPTALLSATNTGSAISIGPKIVEGLLTYDLDFTPRPQLATEWSVSDDGLTYTFKLREGVKWHDGEDFDADDVVFSILALKQVHPRGRGTLANVTEVKALGSHEVQVTLSDPAPYLLKALAALESPILPQHIFDGTDIPANPALNAPIGTGPFVFKEWIRAIPTIGTRASRISTRSSSGSSPTRPLPSPRWNRAKCRCPSALCR